MQSADNQLYKLQIINYLGNMTIISEHKLFESIFSRTISMKRSCAFHDFDSARGDNPKAGARLCRAGRGFVAWPTGVWLKIIPPTGTVQLVDLAMIYHE